MKLFLFAVASILLVSVSSSPIKREGRFRNETQIYYDLYTRRNPLVRQVLKIDEPATLLASNFNASLPTKFFAHGWNAGPGSADSTRNEYLAIEDCNFFSIDWQTYSTGVDYPLIILRNVPITAEHTGEFIEYIADITGANIRDFHLIGFSAGAHVVGGAGATVTSLGLGTIPRITGLDPAHPFLTVNRTDNRLDTTDADFVDVIHTNSGDLLDNELSFLAPIGHIDFYPNGGSFQPGCAASVSAHETRGGCDHGRSVSYFSESINTEIGFLSYECDSYESYEAGLCRNNRQQMMGAKVPSTARGVYYLNTNAAKPFAQG